MWENGPQVPNPIVTLDVKHEGNTEEENNGYVEFK
jgi:hypothetical protein